jgi:LacI family transcriptional regulator
MTRQRPTSADVAREAGVSRTTVSFVLSGRTDVRISPRTRQRVLEAARRLGYHPHAPAQQLAGAASRTLGLVVRQDPEQVAVDALLPATLQGLTSAAQGAGYRVLVEALGGSDDGYGALLRSGRVDGLIVSGPRSTDDQLRCLHDEGYPIVLQGHLPGSGLPSVDVDNRLGARRAVDHLLELGHRVIGLITNAPLEYTAAAERLDGYRTALEEAGLTFDPTLVAEGAFVPESGRQAILTLLARRPDCTAVFVASDVVALGALGGARSVGRRIPEDLSLVGFDDIPLAAFFDPPLTTLRIPAFELGHTAGRTLLDRLHGRPVEPRVLLATELVVRGSAVPLSSGRRAPPGVPVPSGLPPDDGGPPTGGAARSRQERTRSPGGG